MISFTYVCSQSVLRVKWFRKEQRKQHQMWRAFFWYFEETKTDHSGVQTRCPLSLCLPPACGLCSLRIWIRRGSSCACAWLHVLCVSVYRPGKCHRLAETKQRRLSPEMEFLDISLIKGSSLLLHAIHSILYWRILRKTIVFSGFKNSYKKSAKQENSSLFMNSVL